MSATHTCLVGDNCWIPPGDFSHQRAIGLRFGGLGLESWGGIWGLGPETGGWILGWVWGWGLESRAGLGFWVRGLKSGASSEG